MRGLPTQTINEGVPEEAQQERVNSTILKSINLKDIHNNNMHLTAYKA